LSSTKKIVENVCSTIFLVIPLPTTDMEISIDNNTREMKSNRQKEELTDKEEEIMLLFWQHGPLLVKEVMEYLPEPKPHVNTVSTFVRMLEMKGYIGHKAEGGAYRYFAVKPMEDYRRKTVKEVIRNFFNNSYKGAVCSLVEDDILSVGELRELLEMMESKDKNQES